ncbi:MAG: hypothetical protein LLG14_11620 [Nocardiaceae bacterium]|nr:hypothetical protein [Nocardiaceae bacterium]
MTPSVVFPTSIPGCETVQPSSRHFVTFATVGQTSYDNPRFPWFSGRKAVAMSEAARRALPADLEIQFASPNQSLLFQPIDNLPENIEKQGFSGWTDATAAVTRDGAPGSIRVEVRQSSAPPPPCTAGSIDRRITQPDGTVIDVDDSWIEYDGRRALRRYVHAYLPGETQVSVSVDDETGREPDAAKRYSGHLPLSVDEAIRLATDPALRVHAPIPSETSEPPSSCSSFREDPGPDIDRTTAARLNDALNDVWSREGLKPALDRPLGSLQLADYSRDALCEKLTVSSGPATGQLTLSISGGHKLPKLPSDYDPDRPAPNVEISTLADGSVLQTTALVGRGTASRLVTLTRTSGTQVHVEFDGPETLLSTADLQRIASAPSLELPR